MKAIWSDEADKTFAAIVDSINRRFSEKEVNAFLEQTFAVIDAVETFPKLYPSIKVKGYKRVHKAVIHPHSTLFYEISKEQIDILFFWDNRDNPEKLK